MTNTILKCENLNKSFGKKKILKDVSFTIKKGDILGFIGPNGSGKTTTIKLILGLNSIDSGNVTINGFDIKKDFESAIKGVGAIVENPDMYMYLSGYENLKLVANMYNVSSSKIDEVVKLVKLEGRIKDKVSKYSLGMRQRLGIAQALINSPNLLILDEPINGLDPLGIQEIRQYLKKLATKNNTTIIISSHILSEIEQLVDTIGIIHHGQLLEQISMNTFREKTKKYIQIEVSDTYKASYILKKAFKIIPEINKNQIIIRKDFDKISQINKLFVKNNIDVYQIKIQQDTLDEYYLKVIGDEIECLN